MRLEVLMLWPGGRATGQIGGGPVLIRTVTGPSSDLT